MTVCGVTSQSLPLDRRWLSGVISNYVISVSSARALGCSSAIPGPAEPRYFAYSSSMHVSSTAEDHAVGASDIVRYRFAGLARHAKGLSREVGSAKNGEKAWSFELSSLASNSRQELCPSLRGRRWLGTNNCVIWGPPGPFHDVPDCIKSNFAQQASLTLSVLLRFIFGFPKL